MPSDLVENVAEGPASRPEHGGHLRDDERRGDSVLVVDH
jgi:hypothetical protein